MFVTIPYKVLSENIMVPHSSGVTEKNTKYQKLLLKILLILVYIYMTWLSKNLCSGPAETHTN